MILLESEELVHMPTNRTRRHFSITLRLLLSLILTLGIFAVLPNPALAVTSAEKQAEADEVTSKLDALQTELNQVTEQYNNAIAAQEAATERMNEAQQRKDAAEARIIELQTELGSRATQMYRGGQSSFLDVLFGAQSFVDFITAWDLMNRLNDKDAQMVDESKTLRNEAEAARAEFEAQAQVAADQKEQARVSKESMEATAASLQDQISKLNEEVAELMAKEEEARVQAEEAARRAAASGANIDPEKIGNMPALVHPCPNSFVSSTFGWRSFDNSHHNGLDLAASTGTPIYAAAAGTVVISGYSGSAGNWVVIMHGSGVVTKYMHASALYVSAGQYVEAGQHIAAVGNTGNSFGAHLHFQIEIDGVPVDPQLFI